jgi:3-ketosteroid 9alpha-monooxygenase subunit B
MAISGPALPQADVARRHGFHPLRIRRVVRETADASSFVLDVPPELEPDFAYEAGQFCTFRVWIDGEPLLRSYSMSSAPAVDDELAVTVKRVPGGAVSNWMNDTLRPGDVVEVTPPAGVFRLGAEARDIVAFSGGSGITPVISLVKTTLATTSRRVRLLYANRDRDSVIFAAELGALVERHGDRLEVVHRYDVEHGFVDDAAIAAFLGGATGGDHYLCGPGPFMDIVESTLLGLDVDAARIHVERFTPAEVPPVEPNAPATTPSRVTVDLDGRVETIDHHPGTTVLQTARQMGLSPPFSCESGTCATCMARLVEGEVTMYVNDALTDDEVAEGWILTCQSVPTTPTIHVIYGYD